MVVFSPSIFSVTTTIRPTKFASSSFVRQYPVIVRGARTPRQVVSSGILYVFLELTCNPAVPEYLLNRLIAKQFAFNPASVWHDDVSPFVVNSVGVEVGQHHHAKRKPD